MEDVNIPRFIDDQLQFYFWELDEVIVMTSIFALGIWLGQMLYSMVGMFVVYKLFVRVKNAAHRGLLLHLAYWHGLFALKATVKNGFDRHFVS